MEHAAQQFTDRAEAFAAILTRAEGRWEAPTPCEGWTVRDVVAHVVQTERDFLLGKNLDVGPAPDLADPAAAWRAHAARAAGVLGQPGVAERAYDGYFGPTTIAATMADFYGWDVVVHGSDVARATGQAWSVGDEEAAALQATADGWGPALYSEGVCAAEVTVPADASASDRLLARLGRDPRWVPDS